MNLPNQLSLFRILLIPAFLVAVAYIEPGTHHPARWAALAIFALAVVTDAVDGFLARIKKQRTELGSYLDPLADKLLLSAAFIALSVQPHLALRPPIWVPIVIISRDAILILGCAVMAILGKRLKIAPSFLGKLTTVTQMAAILFILLEYGAAQLLWIAAAALTVCSGLEYIWHGKAALDQPAQKDSELKSQA